MSSEKTKKMVLCAIFSAIIIVMTVVPYTGYINYGLIEITTLHIPVILGAAVLGWKYGAVLGGVWGITCLIRAFTNPAWVLFTNPLISVIPRIVVGLVAGAVFGLLRRRMRKGYSSAAVPALIALLIAALAYLPVSSAFELSLPVRLAICAGIFALCAVVFAVIDKKASKGAGSAPCVITAVAATLTNTILVLSAIYIFGGMFDSYKVFYELFKTILATLIGLNGAIELAAAVIVVPLLYRAAAPRGDTL